MVFVKAGFCKVHEDGSIERKYLDSKDRFPRSFIEDMRSQEFYLYDLINQRNGDRCCSHWYPHLACSGEVEKGLSVQIQEPIHGYPLSLKKFFDSPLQDRFDNITLSKFKDFHSDIEVIMPKDEFMDHNPCVVCQHWKYKVEQHPFPFQGYCHIDNVVGGVFSLSEQNIAPVFSFQSCTRFQINERYVTYPSQPLPEKIWFFVEHQGPNFSYKDFYNISRLPNIWRRPILDDANYEKLKALDLVKNLQDTFNSFDRKRFEKDMGLSSTPLFFHKNLKRSTEYERAYWERFNFYSEKSIYSKDNKEE
ncbi:MAG: hypothetical protein HQK56_18715 [Deltaproteobacteria bacterium]|nr:hypothetical protein [Deltaproteobacteria bacterium]